MENLLSQIIKGLLGNEQFKIEPQVEEGRTVLTLKVPPELIGLIIGKGGKTIKAIRTLLKIRATLEKTRVDFDVQPLEESTEKD